MTYQDQSGRTMVEMLGVLGIMGIIIYGVVSGINYGMTSYKVNRLYIEIPNIINGVQDMYLTVFGRNTFPQFACGYDSSGNCTHGTDCNYCDSLVENNILPTNIPALVIDTKTTPGRLTLTLATTQEICNRLAQMDWVGESITCQNSNNIKCQDCGENCCSSSPYSLKFTPQ